MRSCPEKLNLNIEVVDDQLYTFAFVRAVLHYVFNFHNVVLEEANDLFGTFDRVFLLLLESVEDSKIMLFFTSFFMIFSHCIYDEFPTHKLTVNSARS